MKRLLLVLALLAGAASAQDIPEPDDYRMDHYRAPVPATLQGGTVLDSEAAHELWEAKNAAFIDVLPRAPKPDNLPEGTIWREQPRHSIPGTVWLPNVGYGAIADETADYFRAGLAKMTGGAKNHPLVFFCLEDCWMSWNAARRAIEWGHTNVYWFPDGTDGWAFLDFPLEEVKPFVAP